jgi:hypothetical protein
MIVWPADFLIVQPPDMDDWPFYCDFCGEEPFFLFKRNPKNRVLLCWSCLMAVEL